MEPFVLLSICLTLFGYIFLHPLEINHDVAILIQTGQLLLEGETPYVDFIELDPPMIMYVNAIPAFFSKLFSIHPILAFSILLGLLNVWLIWVVKQILETSRMDLKREEAYSIPIFFALFALWALKYGVWGQRDYLFTIAFIPYLLIRFVRNTQGFVSTALALIVGILMGIFTAFKQYYLLLLLAPELFYLIKNRSFRFGCETFAVLSILILYGIHFFFLPSTMVKTYFGKWVPMLIHYYHAYDNSYTYLFENLKYFSVPATLIALLSLGFLKNYTTRVSKLIPLLVFTYFFAVSIFIIQHKGWLYHFVPALGIVSVILGILAIESIYWLGAFCRLFLNGTILLSCFWILLSQTQKEHSKTAEAILKYTQPNDRVLIISTSINDAYPALVQTNRRLGSRYTTSFPIAFFAKGGSQSEEKEFIEDLLFDVYTLKPKLILINDTNYCQACPKGFNIYEHLKKFGFIDKIHKFYIRKENVNGFAVLILAN